MIRGENTHAGVSAFIFNFVENRAAFRLELPREHLKGKSAPQDIFRRNVFDAFFYGMLESREQFFTQGPI